MPEQGPISVAKWTGTAASHESRAATIRHLLILGEARVDSRRGRTSLRARRTPGARGAITNGGPGAVDKDEGRRENTSSSTLKSVFQIKDDLCIQASLGEALRYARRWSTPRARWEARGPGFARESSTGSTNPGAFRAALLKVAPTQRELPGSTACSRLRDLPDDGPEIPRGCVPYVPCSVDALLRMVEQARVRSSDVFVDVGCGPGRAAAFVHLLTGAGAIGIEVQSGGLVCAARNLTTRSGPGCASRSSKLTRRR